MKAPDSDLTRLLTETLHDCWATGEPLRYAQQAARSARRRRAVRNGIAVAACAVLLSAGLLVISHTGESPGGRATVAPRGYTIVSDAELLSEVHDRPLLAIRDGERISKIVVVENAVTEPGAATVP